MPRIRSAARRPRASSVDPAAIAERRTRAIEEPLDIRLRTPEPYPLLEVRNPLHGTGYLVMLPEYPARSSALCTCTDFARRGLGTCKHIEAGVHWISEHPDAPSLRPREGSVLHNPATWKRVDQRLAAASKDPAPPSRRWRRAGAALYEESSEE